MNARQRFIRRAGVLLQLPVPERHRGVFEDAADDILARGVVPDGVVDEELRAAAFEMIAEAPLEDPIVSAANRFARGNEYAEGLAREAQAGELEQAPGESLESRDRAGLSMWSRRGPPSFSVVRRLAAREPARGELPMIVLQLVTILGMAFIFIGTLCIRRGS